MEHQWWLRAAAHWWELRQKIWSENRKLQSRHRRLLPLVIADLEGPEGLFASPRSKEYRKLEEELGRLDFKEPNSESRWPMGLSDSKWPMGAVRLAKVYLEPATSRLR
jgi:hypothetical protein